MIDAFSPLGGRLRGSLRLHSPGRGVVPFFAIGTTQFIKAALTRLGSVAPLRIASTLHFRPGKSRPAESTKGITCHLRDTARTSPKRFPKKPCLVPRRCRRQRRQAFTLLGLLIVLCLLTVTATLAIRTTSNAFEHTRYLATREILEETKVAILGTPRSFQGFLANVGRLPYATIHTLDGVPSYTLNELLEQPPGVPLYAAYPATASNLTQTNYADGEVVLFCGWRGPYLQPRLGASTFYSGWGSPLVNSTNSSTYALWAIPGGSFPPWTDGPLPGYTPVQSTTQQIAAVYARAQAFESLEGVGYTNDLSIIISTNEYYSNLRANVWLVSSSGSPLSPPNGISTSTIPAGSVIEARLYGVNPNATAVGNPPLAAMALSVTQATPSLLTNYLQFNFATTPGAVIPAGPKVVRFRFRSASGAITNFSPPYQINLFPGTNTYGDINIPPARGQLTVRAQ